MTKKCEKCRVVPSISHSAPGRSAYAALRVDYSRGRMLSGGIAELGSPLGEEIPEDGWRPGEIAEP